MLANTIRPKAKVMVCFEYDRLERMDLTDATDFDYLLAQDFPCFDIRFKQGKPIIYVRHYLAMIGLPSGCTLEILPKLQPIAKSAIQAHEVSRQNQIQYTRSWVQVMITKTLEQVSLRQLDAPNQATLSNRVCTIQTGNNDYPTTWYSWLKAQYVLHLQAIGTLSPRHYQTQQQNSPRATGKLNIKAQIRQNWHRPHYRVSEQSHLVDDKLLWRFLLTGYQKLHSVNITQDTWHSDDEIKRMFDKFGAIQPLPIVEWQSTYTQLMHDMQIWRQQLPYSKAQAIKQAVAWAWWLMNPNGLQHDGQSHDSHTQYDDVDTLKLPKNAFMLNMNHLFEQWVGLSITHWCASHLPSSRLLQQPSFDWLQQMDDDAIIQSLRPDICIVDANNKVSHVIEIKYKQLYNVTAIKSADLYQLNTYQNHLQANHAWLIYPQSNALMTRVRLASMRCDNERSGDFSLIPFDVQQGMALL